MDPFLTLGDLGIFPVIKIEDSRQAIRLAEALIAGGIPCAEITFRTKAASDSIRAMAEAYPEMLVGAGTVLSIAQAEQAVSAGARFLVSPGFNPPVVDWCLERKIPVLPGIATPSEVLQALNRDLTLLKFFPAEALGGIRYLEAISPALPGVKFIPTGGVSPANLGDWLKLPFVHAVAGSWLASPRLLAEGAFAEITRLASEAVAIVKTVRQGR